MRTKLRTSGNGSSNRQWLYLYINFPVLMLVKIGISGDYQRRARQVNRTTIGWSLPLFAVKIPFAYQCEQLMHRLFVLFNVRFGGSKEWYWLPVAPVALAIMLLFWLLEWLFFILFGFLLIWWMASGGLF